MLVSVKDSFYRIKYRKIEFTFMNAKINFNDDKRSAQLSDLTFESTVRKYPL